MKTFEVTLMIISEDDLVDEASVVCAFDKYGQKSLDCMYGEDGSVYIDDIESVKEIL